MTKILVADDNSNVQRTVTQALTPLHIEVVAVNNGQAAVRKLSEFKPDLVLADIFMPVRNGYELCEYVKTNAGTAHVPVILLAGAFDPLDEHEAQRVGADGILKKPFIPPDCLINMVKTLLEAVVAPRLEPVSVSKASEGANGFVSTAPGAASMPSQDFAEPLPVEPEPRRVNSDPSNQPVAFRSFLDFAGTEQSEDVAIEPARDNEQPGSLFGSPLWQSGAKVLEFETAAAEKSLSPQSTADPRAQNEVADESGALPPAEPLELILEETPITASTIVDEIPVVLDPSKYAPLTVESARAPELASNPLEWMESAFAAEPPKGASLKAEATPKVVSPDVDATEHLPEIPHTADVIETSEPLPAVQSISTREREPMSVQPEILLSQQEASDDSPEVPTTPSYEGPAFPSREILDARVFASVPPLMRLPIQPLPEAVALPESDVADEIETSPALQEHLPAGASPDDTLPWVPKDTFANVPAPIKPSPAPPAIREALPSAAEPAAKIASELPLEAKVEPRASEILPASPEPEAVAQASTPDPDLVEAVVRRVLDKMRPQVVDLITKEFLRPIVQALVHREIDKR